MARVGPKQQNDHEIPESSTPVGAGTNSTATSVTRPLADTDSKSSAQHERARTPVSRALAWSRAGKAHTLVLAVMPVLVAAALLWIHDVPVDLPALLALAVAAALVLGGANLLDAYLDYVRGHALSRTHASTSISPRAARDRTALLALGIYPLDALRVAVIVLAAGAGLGIPAVVAAGLPGVLLGLGGIALAVLYSATTFGLKRLPLGELAVLLALGPGLFTLALLSQHAHVTGFGLALGCALGFYALAALEAANLRAISPEEGDGRLTAIRLLGERGGRWLFIACLAAAYLTVLLAAALPRAPHGAIAVLFSLPALVVPATGVWRARSADMLTPAVRGMLRAYAFFAGWIIAGLLIGALYLRLRGMLGV